MEERAFPDLHVNMEDSDEKDGLGSCWICGAPATVLCNQCGQPVCAAHLKPIPPDYVAIFGENGCEVCVNRTLAEIGRPQASRRPIIEAPVEERTCAYDDEVFAVALPTCEVCGRRVCHHHRYRYRHKFYVGSEGFKSAYFWEFKIRCWEHPWRLHRLKGWELNPTDDRPQSMVEDA